ncbi:hypothetical protein GCM10022252_76930 [Streptosporangium oxazolinicum]|uniref:Pycsar effector protein domain-containing protein n=1 Tax=Streptosporangium oxazolinicum TaxID=909287 RepID=A0ABP8BLJ4_9ACTN
MLRIRWDALRGRSRRRFTAEREPGRILDYVQATLADARRRVRGEDETAAILLFTTGAAAGVVVVGLLNGHWRPGELSSKVEWLWWTSMFFWLMGILVLAGALWRRTAGLAARALERRRFYPGGFAGDPTPGPDPRLGYEVGSSAGVDLLVLEIRRLNALGDAKRRFVRRGVLLMTVSVACCALSVFVDGRL